MKCADCLDSLGAFVDGELPPDEMAHVEKHLSSCSDCSAAHSRIVETSSMLKTNLIRYEAPDVLKARIRASLAEHAGEVAREQRPTLVGRGYQWPRLLAAAATVAIVSSGVTFAAMRQRNPVDSVQQEVLVSHIRSLMPGHLTDIASNDQHNVKPWFNGRVDISPEVPRFDSLGFPLVGGRLDYVDGRNVAVVVYTRRQHIINVFYWPAKGTGESTGTTTSANGYHMIHSRRNGLEVWIVSDLNRAELESFARLLTSSHSQ